MIVDHTDDQKRVVYEVLDNEPVNKFGGKVKLRVASGSQLRQRPGTQERR
jgi:hypothetical protein